MTWPMPVGTEEQHAFRMWVDDVTGGTASAEWTGPDVSILASDEKKVLARLLATLDEMESAAIAAVTTVGEA